MVSKQDKQFIAFEWPLRFIALLYLDTFINPRGVSLQKMRTRFWDFSGIFKDFSGAFAQIFGDF